MTDFDLNEHIAMANLFGSMAGSSMSLRQFAGDTKLLTRLSHLEPISAARTFANLLLQPDLQGQTYRIEILIQLALASGKGKGKIDAQKLRYFFNAIGDGWAGRMEDPPEDVLVYAVRGQSGNFRLLEGLWEGSGFYLQRFVDLVDTMPSGELFDDVRDSVTSMLKLSDAVCSRAGLSRWDTGSTEFVETIDARRATRHLIGRHRLSFSLDELKHLGVEAAALWPFIFNYNQTDDLLDRPPAGSPLETQPLVFHDGKLHVLLPTAFSSAIRVFVISTFLDGGAKDLLSTAISRVYARLWYETPLIGIGVHDPIPFEEVGSSFWGELTHQIDVGRYVHFVFVTDHLDDFSSNGVGGTWNALSHADEIEARSLRALAAAQASGDYRGGLTLVVSCGVGRGIATGLKNWDTPSWRIEFVSAYDLHTLSWLSDFDISTLWKLLDQRDEAERLGLGLMNINGLVNLVGWSRKLNGHVVPHADFEDGSGGGLLAIDQTSLLDVRREVHSCTDPRVAVDVRGLTRRIRRDHDSAFVEDANRPVYASEEPGPRGKPLSAAITPKRVWWSDIDVPSGSASKASYERWKTVRLWMARSAPILDAKLALRSGPVEWVAKFKGLNVDGPLPPNRMDLKQARAEIIVEVHGDVVTTTASKAFELAWLNEENVAERALVEAFVHGVIQLAQCADGDIEAELVTEIVGHPLAKHQHGFAARGFRDWVRSDLVVKPVTIKREDDALTRLGLGWRVQRSEDGPWIEGQAECNRFLSALVRTIEDELISILSTFRRSPLVEQLLLNHERGASDRDIWDRTAASNLALRENQQEAFDTLRVHKFKLNAALMATRLLVEMAICVCPVESGQKAGELDLSDLLARMMLIFELGGWSDAIRWGVMKPQLRVTPLGDVHGNFDWHEEIVTPFGEKTGNDKISEAVADYAENLEELPIQPTIDLEQGLDAGWEDEFGVTFQQTRVFIEHLENEGRRRQKAVFALTRNELKTFSVGDELIDGVGAERLVEKLSLASRPEWRVPPKGFTPKDIFPWRFRRQLSLLRRPLVQTELDVIWVAPGLIREAFMYMLGNYWLGDFPKEQLSPRMSDWQTKVIAERGRKMAEDVSTALKKAGWKTWTEKKLTELLNMRLQLDYGDVDVLAVKDGRVVAIECKDLMYRKTNGEISEQVRDYRGDSYNGKRDELRKHLDRMEVLRMNISNLGKFVGISELTVVESHLVFRNPTPVIFALAQTQIDVKASVLADIGSI